MPLQRLLQSGKFGGLEYMGRASSEKGWRTKATEVHNKRLCALGQLQITKILLS